MRTVTALWALSFVVMSCGTSNDSLFGPGKGDAAPGGGTAADPGGSLGGGGAGGCPSDNAAAGCPCGATAPAACWTGPVADRNRGKCHDGTAQCLVKGEFHEWGPCEGQALDCGGPEPSDASAAPDRGSGGSTSDWPCPCVPGAKIWCDEDCVANIYCSATGMKECLPDGTWSSCRETTQTRPPFACELAGYGCSSCNGGRGYLLGDCASAFACTLPPPPSNCSISGVVDNTGAHVTCNCH
jgi:hypothetical protein